MTFTFYCYTVSMLPHPWIQPAQVEQYSSKHLLLLLLSRFSRVRLLATPWTAAYQAPPSMGFFQARVLEWGAIAFSK